MGETSYPGGVSLGWTVFFSLFLGVYGFVVDPFFGLVGLVAPSVVKNSRDKKRAAEEAATLAMRTKQQEEERLRTASRLEKLENALRNHLNIRMVDVLHTFRMTAKISPMGLRDYRSFDREMIRFLEATLTDAEVEVLLGCGTSVRKIFEEDLGADLHQVLEGHLSREVSHNPSFQNASPLEFEKHCASILRACGWHVTVTPASGDHGVDLIARRNGETVAFQCKLYNNPVGNGAVQEVAAGRIHYGANSAVVVAPNGFTKGATALARSNAVRLIHPNEIQSFFGGAVSSPVSARKSGRHLD